MKVRQNDIIWTYFAKFFSLGTNIILLPLIMSYLTDTELALWYVFVSISQIVNLFDFGFTPTISRHMTYAWSGAKTLQKQDVGYAEDGKPNEKLMSQVYHTCVVVYFSIAVVALVVMLSFGSVYIYEVLKHNFTKNMFWSWIIYALSIGLNLFYGYYSSLLQGIGAIAERNKIVVYSKIVQMVTAFFLMVRGYGLVGFVISYALSGIVLRIIGRKYFFIKIKGIELNVKISYTQLKDCFSTIWFTAWRDGLVMLSQYLMTQANTLICAYYIDLSSTSSYGVLTQIFTMISMLASALYSTYQPALSSAMLQKKLDEQKKIVCKTSFVYNIIFVISTIGFFTVGIPILHWLRPTMEINYLMIVLLALFYYLHQQQSLFCSMIAAGNQLPYCKSYIITSIFTILLSILVAKYKSYGIMGLIFVQIITDSVYNNWKWPKYMLKKIGINYFQSMILGYRYLKREG